VAGDVGAGEAAKGLISGGAGAAAGLKPVVIGELEGGGAPVVLELDSL
jgi:hypothetical protein